MCQKGEPHQLAVADCVGDECPCQNDNSETCEAATSDGAEFSHGETVLLSPLTENSGADTEADSSGQNRHKACVKQSFCIGCRGVTHVSVPL